MATLTRVKLKLSSALQWLHARPFLALPLLALALTVILEILNRRGLIDAVLFMLHSPLVFLLNALIVCLTLLPALLARRQRFVMYIICEIWLGLGVANFVVLSYRTTPLGMIDLLLAGTALKMVNNYLSPIQIILILLGFVVVISLAVLLWRKCPKERIRPLRAGISLIVVAVVVAVAGSITAKAMDNRFGNLAVAYDDLGFAYCFSTSVIDRGVSEPEDYSEELVDEICDDLLVEEDNSNVNVIFIQLESFFDTRRYAGINLGYDPTPVFNGLKTAYSSGYLSMPSIGAGTANSEFEVLTGMNLDHFGAGEYPYKTVLLDQTCESLAYSFDEIGYTSTAIHNHIRSFYGRDTVFGNLGFDRFISLEDMEDVSTTPTGWAKDDVLTDEVIKVLDATPEQDFIYTITVQAHGKYTDLPGQEEAEAPETDEEAIQQAWDYYAEQLSGTDAFIGELLSALAKRRERTVVVLFGDHLPSLNIDETLLDTGDQFQTEYVIWSNFGLEKQDLDLQAYQLGAYVQSRLGLCLGSISALHQQYRWDAENEDYQNALQTIEYDMLYGEKFIFDQANPYFPKNLELN